MALQWSSDSFKSLPPYALYSPPLPFRHVMRAKSRKPVDLEAVRVCVRGGADFVFAHYLHSEDFQVGEIEKREPTAATIAVS
jgi:hypothetical protein